MDKEIINKISTSTGKLQKKYEEKYYRLMQLQEKDFSTGLNKDEVLERDQLVKYFKEL